MAKISQGKQSVFTTNYVDTFIQVAEDCGVTEAVIPALREKKGASGPRKTQGRIQYELLQGQPYHLSSDEVLFLVYAMQNGLVESELDKARVAFFSKAKACFRASVLCKKFGWGVHFNKEGKMAIYGTGTEKYRQLSEDSQIQQLKAMRNSRVQKG